MNTRRGDRRRLLLLAGPSGCGKSSLVKHMGLPRLRLDDFYRDGDDPVLPRMASGLVDWDDDRSWDGGRALVAIRALVHTGRAEVPVYEIGEDRTVAHETLDLGEAPAFVAEGIFAAELVAACRAEGLLTDDRDAVVLVSSRWVNGWRRLRRDLEHGRKAPSILVRRGLKLWRREPAVVARMVALGATPCDRQAVHDWLAAARSPRTGLRPA